MLKNLSTMIEDKLYSTFTAQEEGGIETPETPAEGGVEETPVSQEKEEGAEGGEEKKEEEE